MRKSYFIPALSVIACMTFMVSLYDVSIAQAPLPPDASKTPAAEEAPEMSIGLPSLSVIRPLPETLRIGAIGLDAPVEHLGLDDQGRMDVPDGSTPNVGWYRYGTSPGETGSAVLDAHVYAAFKNLHRVEKDDRIEVVMSDDSTRVFIVEETKTHRLEDVPRDTLFNRADDERLNLITCAGTWDEALDTYSHRLIVYAKLAE